MAKFDLIVNGFMFEKQIQNKQRKIIEISIHFSLKSHLCFNSQEHCTNQVTGFPVRKLIAIPLNTFFGIFVTFFGNNCTFLQCLLIRKLLLDEAILLSHEPQNIEFICCNRGFMGVFHKTMGKFLI